jgi:hypothetical protein
MRRFVVLCLLALPLCAQVSRPSDVSQMQKQLEEIGRVASVMVDGDVCQRIVTQRALAHMLRKDSRDQWVAGDNYDVDDQAFVSTKKTLMRLARLADFPVDANLWMPVEGVKDRVQVVIRNRFEMSQFWSWGELMQETPAPMREVLRTGKHVVVKQTPGYVSALAPIRNSLDETVGVVEVVSKFKPDPRENVK